MNSRLALRRISAVITAILLLSGCGTTAIESPSMLASTAPASATPAAPSSASPSASQVPSESLSPEPEVSSWTGLVWSDPATPSAPGGLQIEDVVSWAGGYVAVGETALPTRTAT